MLQKYYDQEYKKFSSGIAWYGIESTDKNKLTIIYIKSKVKLIEIDE